MNKQDRDCIETIHSYMLSDDDYLHGDRAEINHICSRLEKLGQLENFEDEFGIDLITLLKANDDGAYYKEDLRHYIANIDLKHECVRLDKHFEAEDDFDFHYVMFKDYGKTWALTKEELLELHGKTITLNCDYFGKIPTNEEIENNELNDNK